MSLRRCAILLLLAVGLTACGGGAPSTRALLPPHEQAVIIAGAEQIPANARLSIDLTKALAEQDPGKVRAHRQLFLKQAGLGLGLLKRFVDNPSGKGRFLVTADSGPGSTVLGRAAAALAGATAALDVAVLDAPTAIRTPTLQLRAALVPLTASVRRGNTVRAFELAHVHRLVAALVATGAANRLKVRAAKAPDVVAVVVVPQWRIALKTRIARARGLINTGLGALRRYLVAPAHRGAFGPAVSARSRLRAEHRALEALQFASQQWALAASSLRGIARDRGVAAALSREKRALAPLVVAARAGILRATQAAGAALIIDAMGRAGIPAKLRLRPTRSPTFVQ